MDTRTTFGLRLEQLENLFCVAAEYPKTDRAGDNAEAVSLPLTNQLDWRFPENCFLLDSLLLVLGRLGCDVKALCGRTLKEILLSRETDPGLLQAIRDYCKRASASTFATPESTVATTIYFAAIAASLVHHDRRMTGHGYDVLEESFSSLMGKSWIDRQLKELFSQACDLCRGKGDGREGQGQDSRRQ